MIGILFTYQVHTAAGAPFGLLHVKSRGGPRNVTQFLHSKDLRRSLSLLNAWRPTDPKAAVGVEVLLLCANYSIP